jgi:lambda repressor-like predicted transcriptional regulator
MPNWTEESMQQALFAVRNGLSSTKASKEYGIPHSTLRNRLSGAVPKKQDNIDRQALSDVQESHLAQWARIQEALGQPPTHFQLRRAAEMMLQAGGVQRSLGKNWITHFRRRNPPVRTL